MKYVVLSLLLIGSCICEVSFLPIPLTLLFLCLFAIFFQTEIVFLFAIVAGALLDSLLFRPLGATSLFFVIFLGLLFAYRQKFEVQNILFVILFGLWGIISYFLLFGSTNFFVQVISSLIILSMLYSGLLLCFRRQKAGILY